MRSKNWFHSVLRTMLGFYDNYRNILRLEREEAINRTLESYDDFYERLSENAEEWEESLKDSYKKGNAISSYFDVGDEIIMKMMKDKTVMKDMKQIIDDAKKEIAKEAESIRKKNKKGDVEYRCMKCGRKFPNNIIGFTKHLRDNKCKRRKVK